MIYQAMETGDQATWVSAVVAAIAIIYTYVQSHQQKKSQARAEELQRQASEIAARQAEAAERRALATEQMLERFIASSLPPGQGGEAHDQRTSRKPVDWSLAREKDLFVLRNEGDEVATDVCVTTGDNPTGLAWHLPENAVVRAHEAVEFLMAGSMAAPMPRQIYVTWAGHEDSLVIPVPAR